jgi:hypothetical protein
LETQSFKLSSFNVRYRNHCTYLNYHLVPAFQFSTKSSPFPKFRDLDSRNSWEELEHLKFSLICPEFRLHSSLNKVSVFRRTDPAKIRPAQPLLNFTSACTARDALWHTLISKGATRASPPDLDKKTSLDSEWTERFMLCRGQRFSECSTKWRRVLQFYEHY